MTAPRGGHFGPHNVYQNRPDGLVSEDLIFATYQNAGIRSFDIRNPIGRKNLACSRRLNPPARWLLARTTGR